MNAADSRSYTTRIEPSVGQVLRALDDLPSNSFPEDDDAFQDSVIDLMKTLEQWLHSGKQDRSLLISRRVEESPVGE
jgi:hypothetical protein